MAPPRLGAQNAYPFELRSLSIQSVKHPVSHPESAAGTVQPRKAWWVFPDNFDCAQAQQNRGPTFLVLPERTGPGHKGAYFCLTRREPLLIEEWYPAVAS